MGDEEEKAEQPRGLRLFQARAGCGTESFHAHFKPILKYLLSGSKFSIEIICLLKFYPSLD